MDAAAADFVAVAAEAIAERGRCLVALSGGSTPRGMYERLAGLGPGALDWSRVIVLWSDERSVPPDHAGIQLPDGARGPARAPPDPGRQMYRMRGEDEDIEAAARDYERTLATLTGVQPGHGVPQLDLVLLGLGSDGHTASLFGDTVALDVRDRWVVRNYVAKFTTSRLTLTFPVILAAREIRVLVAGAEKADTLAAVLAGDRDPDRLPAQRLATPPVTWCGSWIRPPRRTNCRHGATADSGEAHASDSLGRKITADAAPTAARRITLHAAGAALHDGDLRRVR